MSHDHGTDDTTEYTTHPLRRRRFLLAGGVGVALLAGCTDMEQPGGDGTPTTASTASTGTFRLLISDRPNAIDDFDQLNVTFDEARVFPGNEADTPEPTATPTPNETVTATPNETVTPTPNETPDLTPTPDTDSSTDQEEQDGFFFLDLAGATVDLTEVVGDRAIGVFEGDLDAGEYQKIELHVEAVEGILTTGETASVKVPSEKLQIVHPFEIEPEETVSFVFDINVVARGNTGAYNLLPVISGSGVAGRDVDVEEVEPDDTDE